MCLAISLKSPFKQRIQTELAIQGQSTEKMLEQETQL